MDNRQNEIGARSMMPTRKLDELVRSAISDETPQENADEVRRLARELAAKLAEDSGPSAA